MLLLTVTGVSTACAVVIFRVKASCITSVDGIGRHAVGCYWPSVSLAVMLLAMKTRNLSVRL